MVHFKKSSHDKYICPRSSRNYSNYAELKKHGLREKCNFESEYPPQRFFVDKTLFKLGIERGKVCRRCKRNFKFVSLFDDHLIACMRLHFPCTNCPTKFAQYKPARIHSEKCDGTGIGANKNIFYGDDKVDLPAQELKSKTWTDKEIMEVIRNDVVQKLTWLFSMYPEGALGLVSMNSQMSKRMTDFNLSWQAYKREEAKKVFVPGRLRAFFMLESIHSTSVLKDGKFYDLFGAKMNQQAVQKPSILSGYLDEPAHYVFPNNQNTWNQLIIKRMS